MIVGILREVERGMLAIVIGVASGIVLAGVLILLIDHFYPAVR
jgi:hypothetical protein